MCRPRRCELLRTAYEVLGEDSMFLTRDLQRWDVWLRTRKQRLALFTVLLMLALGLITGPCAGIRRDCDQEHRHVDSEPMNGANSYSRRIPVDSGATAANLETGVIRLLKNDVDGLNVVTS